jgi:probable rRNA maturation factor
VPPAATKNSPGHSVAGRISLMYEKGQKVPRPAELSRLALKVAQGEKLSGKVDIAFCSDQKVRALNKAYRKLDKVTDVLSFGWDEEDFAGEIFVANPQAKRQAPRFNNNYFNELRRLIVHGMLHLCGYDHMKSGERLVMREKEDLYLAPAGSGRQKGPETVPKKRGEKGTKPPPKPPKTAKKAPSKRKV